MKKTIVTTLFLVILSFGFGFWINQKFYSNVNSFEIGNETLKDTAEINLEKFIENVRPTFTIRGGIPDPKDRYRYIVDRWYHFSFRVTSGGCTNQYEYSIDHARNHTTDSILKKRIGKNWRDRFEKSVDSLYNIDTLAIHIAKNDTDVKLLINKKLSKKYNNYVNYKCYPTTNHYVKIVSVEWEGKIYNDSTEVSFIRAIVNLKEEKVIEIEKTEMNSLGFF